MKNGRYRRSLLAIVLGFGMALMGSATALAEASSVTYDGNAKEFVFVPQDADLFQDFKGVMPGDVLHQRIEVQNEASKNVAVKIYLKAEPVSEQDRAFLQQLSMQVTFDGDAKLFDAPASEQAGLANWGCLGTFQTGAQGMLDVTLAVPLSLDSTYMDAKGTVPWTFMVEEIPLDPPKTGERTYQSWALYLMALAAAGAVIALCVRHRRA